METLRRSTYRWALLSAFGFLVNGMSECARAYAGDGAGAGARAAYFPNTKFRTQDGKEVLFYDDLVKGKIVVINFMYTRCEGRLCGEGTKNLVRLQNALGKHFARDVFIYSITLQPENDTPEVLKNYAKEYGARWTFLTPVAKGNAKKLEEVTDLRKKLGLFKSDPKLDADLKQHTGMIVIGNAALNKWTRTSVLSNPTRILQMIERLKPPRAPSK